MNQILLNGIIVLIVAFLIGNLMTTVFQSYFIFRPTSLDPEHRFEFENPFEEVTIESEQGTLNAIVFRNSNRRGIVLYCHGNSGDLQKWGKEARFFLQHGYDFICFDYRGFGKSKGKKTENLMNIDAQRVMEFTLDQGYASNEIVLYGRSIGSTFASFLASKYNCKMTVLETPFYGLKSLFYTYYPILPRLFLFSFKMPVYEYVQQAKSPVYVLQGTEDLIIPFRDASKLIEHTGEESFFVIEGAGHNNLSEFGAFNQAREKLFR